MDILLTASHDHLSFSALFIVAMNKENFPSAQTSLQSKEKVTIHNF